MTDGLQATEWAVADGDRDVARKAVLALDRRFGGLLGAEIIALADRCNCNLFHESITTPDKTPR